MRALALAGMMLVGCDRCASEPPSAPVTEMPTLAPAPALALAGTSACTIDEAHHVVCWGVGTASSEATRMPSTEGTIALDRALDGSYCALRDSGSVVCWAFGDAAGAPHELFAVAGATELAVAWRQVCARAGALTTCHSQDSLGGPVGVPEGAARVLGAGPFVCAIDRLGGLACDSGSMRFDVSDEPILDVDLDGDRVCVASSRRVRCTALATIDLRLDWVEVEGLGGGERIAVGSDQVCALSGGRVRCAGWSGRGALGPAAPPAARGAWDVPLSSPAIAIDADGATTCARTAEGVSCFGELRDGIAGRAPVGLARVEAGEPIVAIDAHDGTCAVLRSGAVSCWGPGRGGRIGDGELAPHALPTLVPGIAGASAVLAGYEAACAIVDAPADQAGLWCWGGGDHRHAGSPARRIVPGPFVSVVFAQAIGVLRAGGEVEQWDASTGGRATAPPDLPPTADFEGAREIALMGAASCALLEDGHVTCLGSSANGETGTGSRGQLSSPRRVAAAVSPDAEGIARASEGCEGHACGELEGVTHLVGWTFGACAVLADGGLACWGSNDDGETSSIETGVILVPVRRTDVHDVRDACVGFEYACALEGDGHVACWGAPSAPTILGGAFRQVAHASALTCGQYHACVILEGGGAHCWGHADEGRLGSSAAIRATPAFVPGTR